MERQAHAPREAPQGALRESREWKPKGEEEGEREARRGRGLPCAGPTQAEAWGADRPEDGGLLSPRGEKRAPPEESSQWETE